MQTICKRHLQQINSSEVGRCRRRLTTIAVWSAIVVESKQTKHKNHRYPNKVNRRTTVKIDVYIVYDMIRPLLASNEHIKKHSKGSQFERSTTMHYTPYTITICTIDQHHQHHYYHI